MENTYFVILLMCVFIFFIGLFKVFEFVIKNLYEYHDKRYTIKKRLISIETYLEALIDFLLKEKEEKEKDEQYKDSNNQD